MSIPNEQIKICEKYKLNYFPTDDNLIVGISYNFDISQYPINGLRHPKEKETSGWYLWSGEDFSKNPDFFVPIHLYHIKDKYPQLYKYLAIPPGNRFLLGENNYEDVWEDLSLLDI